LPIQKIVVLLQPITYNTNTFKYNSMATALVQARIEPALKEKAEKYFHAFGMDTATAIRIFFAKVAETGMIPFTIGLDPEDVYDAKIAEEAYQEYVDSGYKSRPFPELLKELDL
jgi:DNA-damage-inducible protein J